ncbi:hypothetical protein M3Y98_00435600 [Aphelenchoides besseyi]|nr:hypothetical protein M3Y98_00435600 [Aphelenchoides besseyi]KAI6202535.1 hypothetical protein M3Y96_00959200 [Aphelenchoides besseyi]
MKTSVFLFGYAKKFKVFTIGLLFQSVVLSSLPSFDPGTCPCMVKPGTNQCRECKNAKGLLSENSVKYDSRFQATNLHEAISFFDDLSLQSEYRPAEQTSSMMEQECKTRECKICRKMLRQRLHAIGLFQYIFKESGFENFIDPETSESDERKNEFCNRYRFSRLDSDTVDYVRHHGLNARKRSHNANEHNWNDGSNSENRFRRNTVINSEFIGTRYNLSCVPKGAAVDGSSNSNLISLCSRCWSWRQLPPNYFPQFVNELVCHDGDLQCLSGYAVCGAGTRTVEVIRNDTNKISIVTLTAGSYCECQVHAGSALQSLVTGTSNVSPMAGIPSASSSGFN